MKCKNCGELNKDNAKFCAGCGEKLEMKKIFCTECGCELEKDSAFCETCGAKQQSSKEFKNNLNNLNIKKIDLGKIDLSSKIISIAFLVCALIGIYLFSKNGFYRWFFGSQLVTANTMAMLAIILGIVIFFIKRKDIDISDMIKHFTKMSFDKNVVAIIFIVSGILIFIIQNNNVFRVDGMQILICLGAFFAFALLILSILAFNWEILKKPFLVLVVVIGLSVFIIAGGGKRMAKKAVDFLESNGYTCSLSDETYKCSKSINNRVEEWEINYYTGPSAPSISLEVSEDDYYSLKVTKSEYNRYGFAYIHEDGMSCYYIPEYLDNGENYLGNVNSLEVGVRLKLERKYSGDDCRNRSSLVNETLRKYESLYSNLGLDIKS